MNTANLQMEGLLLVLAALCAELKSQGALSEASIAGMLSRAEEGASVRETRLSDANAEAVMFPIRFVRMALRNDAQALDYQALAAEVGRQKDRPAIASGGVA